MSRSQRWYCVVLLVLSTGVAAIAQSEPPAPAANPTATPRPFPTRVRVSSGIAEALLVHKVQPVYPARAKKEHIQGVVSMSAIIGKDGQIKELKLISGPPFLDVAALDAVRQWQYKPYLLNGLPVEMDTMITVNFTISN